MDSRIRILFFAVLALVLGPAALPEASGQPAGKERHAFEQPPVEHEAHPAASLGRLRLADLSTGCAPFAPTHPAGWSAKPVPPLFVVAAATPDLVRAADATRRLPLSRAPPHLS